MYYCNQLHTILYFRQMKLKLKYIASTTLTGMMLLMTLSACSASTEQMDVDTRLEDIASVMAYGRYDMAQDLSDELLDYMTATPDSSSVTESQAGTLGIMYMKLSEHQNEDENVADATMCMRHAFRLSTDSLKSFSESLSLDDQRHFVLLRRIGLSIDNPVDLTGDDIAHEDSIANL